MRLLILLSLLITLVYSQVNPTCGYLTTNIDGYKFNLQNTKSTDCLKIERPLKNIEVHAFKIHDNCNCEFFHEDESVELPCGINERTDYIKGSWGRPKNCPFPPGPKRAYYRCYYAADAPPR